MLKKLGPSYKHWYEVTLTLDKNFADPQDFPKLGMKLMSQTEYGFELEAGPVGVEIKVSSGNQWDLAPFFNHFFKFGMSRESQKTLLTRQIAKYDKRTDHCKECSRQVRIFIEGGSNVKSFKKSVACGSTKKHKGWEVRDTKRCEHLQDEIIKFHNKNPDKLAEMAMANPLCTGGCSMEYCPYKNVCELTLLSVTCREPTM